jgi:hypothetical protein
VAFETILNAAWLVMGFLALAAILVRAPKSKSSVSCLIGVALIIATLFPVISASDDVIRIQHLDRTNSAQQKDSSSGNHKRTTDNLIRLYEAMESPMAVSPVRIDFVLLFAFLVFVSFIFYIQKRTIAESGRSPPSFA